MRSAAKGNHTTLANFVALEIGFEFLKRRDEGNQFHRLVVTRMPTNNTNPFYSEIHPLAVGLDPTRIEKTSYQFSTGPKRFRRVADMYTR
jgi:hypothetical protein